LALRLLFLIIIMSAIFSVSMVLAEDSIVNPEPYQPEEFPGWALDIRRASVIGFGSLPVTLLVANIVYEVWRFGVKSFEAGEPAYAYAPLFFAPADGIELSDDDRKKVLRIGVSAAAIVATADYVLGLFERSRDKKRGNDAGQQ
ncbi:MAG: hypothetical protein D6B26_00540, partial [Spirochaetaceae bacterium]